MAPGKKTVLVTGGAGRLGRALIAELIRQGMAVRALVQRKDDVVALPPGTVPYVGDITDEYTLSEACSGADAVVHLAAIVSQYRTGSREILRTNTLGTRKVAEAARAARVKKIVFASTVNVYGRVRKEKLDERSEPRPTDTYGQSKALAEKEIINSGIDYTILRMAALYGPGFEGSFYKILRIIRDGKAHIIGSGRNHLAFLNVNDAIRAFVLALGRRASRNQIYNITDGRDYTQGYLFELAADLLGVKRPDRHISPILVHIVAKARGLDTDEVRFITSNRLVDISKARRQLGFRPRESVESGAGYLLERFNANRRR